jgi:hypothetical protein
MALAAKFSHQHRTSCLPHRLNVKRIYRLPEPFLETVAGKIFTSFSMTAAKRRKILH